MFIEIPAKTNESFFAAQLQPGYSAAQSLWCGLNLRDTHVVLSLFRKNESGRICSFYRENLRIIHNKGSILVKGVYFGTNFRPM